MSRLQMLSATVALLIAALGIAATEGAEIAVFVHGLAGFGPEELGPIQYWAYKDEFEDAGFDVFEATVSPIASNYDRACQLYAQIIGAQVDFGAAHSSANGHARFGRDFTGEGFVPLWSTSLRIHLIGHSMGGSTILELEAMLQDGVPAEVSATGSGTSALFTGQGNLIKSVTTFSTPHDGTPLVDILGDSIIDVITDLILGFAAVSQETLIADLYDFEMDHWGLGYQEGESFSAYFARIKADPAFDSSNQDLAPFDLSIQGAFEAQQRRSQQAYDGTFYFAFATEMTANVWTCKNWRCGWQAVPRIDMWIVLQPFAALMGALSQPAELRATDGLVPFESGKCPKLAYGGGGCTEYKWYTTWTSGKWYWQQVSRDHLQIIGFSFLYFFATDNIYATHANRILDTMGGAARASKEDGDSDFAFGLSSSSQVAGVVGGSIVGAVAVAGVAALLITKARKRKHHNTMLHPQPNGKPARSLSVIVDNPAYRGNLEI